MSGKCPRCHKENTLVVVRKEGGKLKCDACSYMCTDDQTDELFGLKRIEGEIPSFENTGNKWEQFPSWFCLKFFNTLEDRVAHDKKYHKDGDVQLGMFPVGYTIDSEVPKCGND